MTQEPQPFQSLQAMLGTKGWQVFSDDVTERLQTQLNTLLQTDDPPAKLRGEILALRWVLDRPHTLVREATDAVKRGASATEAAAHEEFLLQYGRNSPIPPPNAARPEIS